MPSHSHGYQKFRYDDTYVWRGENNSCDYYPNSKTSNFLERAPTGLEGGGKAHNNMPPYLTANCWRRAG